MRVGASLRGIEVTAVGALIRSEDKLILEYRPGVSILLAPLTTKVQWDLEKKKPIDPTRAESQAFESLGASGKTAVKVVEITGPIRFGSNGKPARLEVRAYHVFDSVPTD